MKFTLIICTYMRPEPVLQLLKSVQEQTYYPDEILIIDGSTNTDTEVIIKQNLISNLKYYAVPPQERGLTRQRNYGISRVSPDSEVVCFLDDDIILIENYFQNLLNVYTTYPDALGVGGYIVNEVKWSYVGDNYSPSVSEFLLEGWIRKESSRFVLRKKIGLDSDCRPGYSPLFSHGRSVGFLPPSGKIYPVEQLMGGVSSFKNSIFKTVQFSPYFEGYGLYEDADFTLRVSKLGTLYLNTNAKLFHFHAPSGRPNQYRYGKMVVRNGWYVWRVKHPNTSVIVNFKWYMITILLLFIRMSNIVTSKKKKEAATETLGRLIGLFSLIFDKPKILVDSKNTL